MATEPPQGTVPYRLDQLERRVVVLEEHGSSAYQVHTALTDHRFRELFARLDRLEQTLNILKDEYQSRSGAKTAFSGWLGYFVAIAAILGLLLNAYVQLRK